MQNKWKFRLELLIAFISVIAGLTLLFLGFYANPIGEISHSVLLGTGEALTFGGAILGVDYHYRIRYKSKGE